VINNNTISGEVDSAREWHEFPAGSIGSVPWDLHDSRDGRCARMIVMIDAGDLLCENADGRPRHLHGLPAGYTHMGYVGGLSAGQTAGIVVYW
jgi:hypothetical protein